jgi:hypothetical protein
MADVLARRDMIQINSERLSPETIREIEELVARRENKRIEVAIPRDRLESLFLRIVESAHARRVETAGSAATGDIAGFLGESQGRELIESLVNVESAAKLPIDDVATPVAESETESVLSGLQRVAETPQAAQPPKAESPALPPQKDAPVDRDVLSQLTGGQDQSS